MAERGRSARETQAEIEAARLGQRVRPSRRLAIPQGRGLYWLLLGLVLGVILAVVSIAVLPEGATEWITDLRSDDTESGYLEATSEGALPEPKAGAKSVTIITSPGSSVVEVATRAEATGTSPLETTTAIAAQGTAVVETSDGGVREPMLAEQAVVGGTSAMVVTPEAAGEPDISDSNQPEPALPEEVFADIFLNATRVDRLSLDDIKSCRGASQCDVEIGDIVSVEVAFARKEPEGTRYLNWDFFYFRVSDTSDDGVLGNETREQSLRFSPPPTASHPFDDVNSGPSVVALYRTRLSGWTAWPEDANIAIGEWAPKYNASLVPGTYTVRLLENENSPGECERLLEKIDVATLIPDSVLIAWYVN